MSALTRIAYNDHPPVSVERGDTVILSARPVPGNELRVHDTINQLSKAGAEVLHEENAAVHVSGHASQEEMRTLYGLVRPKAVMPIHGEYRMQAATRGLRRTPASPPRGSSWPRTGSVVEVTAGGARIVDNVESGVTFVDGLGVGDIGDVALRDRRHMAEDGVLIVVATLTSSNGARSAAAELIARGFAETEPLLDEMRAGGRERPARVPEDNVVEIKLLQEHLHDGIGQLVYDRTRRRPMILPVVVEVCSTRLVAATAGPVCWPATPRRSGRGSV